jgi:hypothetical protein
VEGELNDVDYLTARTSAANLVTAPSSLCWLVGSTPVAPIISVGPTYFDAAVDV